jgi:hypothetical protein
LFTVFDALYPGAKGFVIADGRLGSKCFMRLYFVKSMLPAEGRPTAAFQQVLKNLCLRSYCISAPSVNLPGDAAGEGSQQA